MSQLTYWSDEERSFVSWFLTMVDIKIGRITGEERLLKIVRA